MSNDTNSPDDSSADYLSGIAYPHPFDDYAVDLCKSASRYICILSPALDHAVFDNAALSAALSDLVRVSRQTRVRILVNDKRAIVSRGHRLLALYRRLPSSVQLHVLSEHPDWNGETFVVRDRSGVLYKPGGSEHQAFLEADSRASAARYLELFDDLWRFSAEDHDLRMLSV